MDIHSYGRLVLWPWGFSSSSPPNATELQTLGRKFAFFNDYDPAHHIWYDVDGATDDFAYGRLGLSSFVFEIGTSFFQDCASFQNNILPDNLPALIYAAKSARRPYMTPSGPEVLNAAASPAAVASGAPASLTARADDTRFNNLNGTEPTQNIAAAEYYIDVPPWSTSPAPAAHAMTPSDGAFDSKIEDVQAVINTSSLGLGRHTVFVRGRDASGNWGPVSAAFLYIINPDVAPTIEGYVRDFATNAPLAASVSAGAFITTSDPGSGLYTMNVVSGTYDLSAQAPGYSTAGVGNVFAPDNSLVQQNLYLQPVCFSDDVESGNQGWTVEYTWAITDEVSHSPTYAWTDSPGSYYENNRDSSLYSRVIDLSQASGVELSFWHTYDIEFSYDYGYVLSSIDGGYTWITQTSYTGVDMFTWTKETIPLPQLDGQDEVQIRFRLVTDPSEDKDGWFLDDIQLYGTSSSCITPTLPVADFSSSNPVLPGESVRFSDRTQGTHPLTYSWDFGDGVGTSSYSDPIYTYAASGTYMVTMTVTNSLGSDTVTHPVVVEQCTPLSTVTLTLQTTGTLLLGAPVAFQADIGPDDAYKPYHYSIDYGDGNLASGTSSDDPLQIEHTYNLPGQFPVQFSAWNCGMQTPMITALPVDIIAQDGIQIAPPAGSLVAAPGETVTYTLLVTNTLQFANTFNVSLSGNAWVSAPSSTILGPLGPDQSLAFSVHVQVPGNAGGGISDTVHITISSQQPGVIPVSAELTTTAAKVYSINFQPEVSSQIGLPGGTATYVTVLTNTGNISDTYSIAIDSDWPYEFSVVPQEYFQDGNITLEHARGAALQTVVSIPVDKVSGDSDIVYITVTSTGDPLLSQQVRLETTAIAYVTRLPLVLAN